MMSFKYLGPEPDRAGGRFAVWGVGVKDSAPPGLTDRRNSCGDWLVTLFYDPVQAEIGGELKSLAPNSLLIWPPSSPHRFGNAAATWRFSWLHCCGNLVPFLLDKCGLAAGEPFVLEDAFVFERHLLSMYAEISGHREPDNKILQNLLDIMLRELARERASSAPPPENILRAKTHIERNFTADLDLAGLAKLACLSIPHFSSEFKRRTGLSPIEYMITLRMRLAGYLLLNNNAAVGEIARESGHSDIYHFSKLFKKYFGLSPSEYRKKKGSQNTPAGIN